MSDNVVQFPSFTFDRVRQEITAAFANVRTGRTELWAAQAAVLAALDALEAHQARMREAHNSSVSATGEGKLTRDPRITSARAAARIAPRTGTQRAAILAYIVEHDGATDYELASQLKMLPNSVRPRRGELVEGGYIQPAGRTRRHRGSDWEIWAPTPDGVEWHEHNANGAAAA